MFLQAVFSHLAGSIAAVFYLWKTHYGNVFRYNLKLPTVSLFIVVDNISYII